ncbi:SGM_3592 family protein [Streptomyces sp. NPDC005141]
MASEEPRGDGRDEAGDESGSRDAAGERWDDLVLDENFIRSAETTEPSARARMLAARWREGGPDPQPWRSDEPPAGWFFSKGRRRRWRRR